ncbi:hypothetical protein BDY24DRAFT_437534 [Mrakia frigida]|uniref:uncharacterized protein n=1 Tax=Mrakia frigida TaxID=29902 RepID=UPI003FCBF40A
MSLATRTRRDRALPLSPTRSSWKSSDSAILQRLRGWVESPTCFYEFLNCPLFFVDKANPSLAALRHPLPPHSPRLDPDLSLAQIRTLVFPPLRSSNIYSSLLVRMDRVPLLVDGQPRLAALDLLVLSSSTNTHVPKLEGFVKVMDPLRLTFVGNHSIRGLKIAGAVAGSRLSRMTFLARLHTKPFKSVSYLGRPTRPNCPALSFCSL